MLSSASHCRGILCYWLRGGGAMQCGLCCWPYKGGEEGGGEGVWLIVDGLHYWLVNTMSQMLVVSDCFPLSVKLHSFH